MSPPNLVDAKPAPPAREHGRRWTKPALLAGIAVVLLLIPIWAPLFLRRMSFFRVRNVEIVGTRYVEPRELLVRLRVDTLDSIWDPPGRWEARVTGHPLVKEVDVGRRLPGTLVVRIVEHVPVALVPGAQGFRAFDARGVALPIDPTAADVDAPIVARADSGIFRFLGTVRSGAPDLYRRLSEVRRHGGAGELVIVIDSLPVRTPADVTLQQLADAQLVERDLERRRVRPIELDLRYRDQVIARLP